MQTILDYYNRKYLGNSGDVTQWTNKDNEDRMLRCKALVRPDGKILSPVDCWEGLEDYQYPSNVGRIMERADGPYLVPVRDGNRFEIYPTTFLIRWLNRNWF